MTTYHDLEVEGLSVFYREAGDPDKPVNLLLHGFSRFKSYVPRSNTCFGKRLSRDCS